MGITCECVSKFCHCSGGGQKHADGRAQAAFAVAR
jgi:hypothetical protein